MSFRKDDVAGLGLPPGASGSVEITVHANSKYQGDPVFPQTITLTNVVHTVRWHCADLPRGAFLQIYFPADPHGPFLSLVEAFLPANPKTVTGYGNRGPGKTLKEYDYEARIVRTEGTFSVVGYGRLINNATEVVNDPRSEGDPPPLNPVGKQN